MSNIFQNPIDFIGDKKLTDYNAEELIDIYKSKENHNYTLNWFDNEFFKYTNVDIFSLPFNTAKDYAIYKLPQFDLLIIKMEKLNKAGCQALNEFVNMDIDTLTIENTSEQRVSNEIASEFKKYYKEEKIELNRVYNSKLVKHFYSPNELNKFKNKWLKK